MPLGRGTASAAPPGPQASVSGSPAGTEAKGPEGTQAKRSQRQISLAVALPCQALVGKSEGRAGVACSSLIIKTPSSLAWECSAIGVTCLQPYKAVI